LDLSFRKEIFLVSLLALLGLNIFFLFPGEISQQAERLQSRTEARITEGLEQSVKGVHLIESRGEQSDWELWADQADRLRNEEVWNLAGVRSHFFGQDGVIYKTQGRKGTVSEDQKRISISGKVVTNATNGYQFETDHMYFASEERMLVSPGAITLLGPRDHNGLRMTIKGGELRANLANNKIEVMKRVDARKALKNNQWVQIKSQTAVLDENGRSVHFVGNVTIDLNTMRVSGPSAILYLKKDKDMVESIQMAGGVRITDENKWATSEALNANLETETVVLEGRPRIVQSQEELRGEKIILLDGGKRVQVLRGKAAIDPDRVEN
jgi:LPS export ABC transporter protein LptC